jgi:hypothetical protein
VRGEAVQGAALDVVAESLLVVQDVPHDQWCVDDVWRIGSCRVGSATVSTVKRTEAVPSAGRPPRPVLVVREASFVSR